MKISIIIAGIALIAGAAFAMSEFSQGKRLSWRYKMTVEIETPEGIVTGSAVRQMGNDYQVNFPAEASNYGEVSGEAVAVDLGARGVLFALISHASDLRFYYTFPVPWGGGGETPEGYKYYASLPVGTKAVMPLSSAYPLLVTFTDMDDPKSVAVVYERERCAYAKQPQEGCSGRKGDYIKVDRFEELFGEGVKLKSITIEITDEPVTKTGILETFPKFDDEFWKWRKTLKFDDPRKVSEANFSRGSIAEFRRMKKEQAK